MFVVLRVASCNTRACYPTAYWIYHSDSEEHNDEQECRDLLVSHFISNCPDSEPFDQRKHNEHNTDSRYILDSYAIDTTDYFILSGIVKGNEQCAY